MTFEAYVLHARNPARLLIDREIETLDSAKTVLQILQDRGLISFDNEQLVRKARFIVSTSLKAHEPDDAYLLDDEWHREILAGEMIVIEAVPLGKGGSRIIGLIAIAVASYFTAGAAAGAFAAGSTAGAVAGAAAGIAVTIAGTMLLNALLPLPKPTTGKGGETSPNYGISPTGNIARIGQSIPVQYGRFRVYPDYAAQPYTENRSNNAYLYQLFCIGQGEYDIEAINIDKTPIGNYAEVQYEVVTPGNSVTLFPDNVITSNDVQGIELVAPQDSQSDTPTMIGPYVTNPAGTQASTLSIDITYPQGVFFVSPQGNHKPMSLFWSAEYQQIDDSGNPLTGWIKFAGANGDTFVNKPENFTLSVQVPPGRYQVRAHKDNYGDSGDQYFNKVFWQGLRAYLPSRSNYGNLTMLAVVMRATNNLNSQTQHLINVVATRKLPIWNGSSWSAPQTTHSPAWAIADIFRNPDYGKGWPDKRIALDSLLALDAVWAQRGDEFNGVFDTKTTIWEAAKAVARVGRATPIYNAGVIDIVRDAPKSVRTVMLTPATIIANSLKITYNFPQVDSADYVQMKYIDPNTWVETVVDCAFDDSPKLNPKVIDFTGCTDHNQAFREGMYMMACSRDQRRGIAIQTELLGLVPNYLDLVGLSHDVPAFGQPGTVLNLDRSTGVLTLSDPVQFSLNQQHYVALSAPNGSALGPYHVVAGIDPYHVRLDQLDSTALQNLYFSDGSQRQASRYAFGPASNQFLDCVMMRAKPSKDGKVTLSLTNYAPSTYLAETNTAIPPPTSPSGLTDPDISPPVDGVGVVTPPGQGEGGYSFVSCNPIPGAIAYEFEISYDGGITWQPLGVSPTNVLRVQIPSGNWIIRARAIGYNQIPGPWTNAPVSIIGAPWPLAPLASLTATDNKVFTIEINWTFVNDLGTFDAGSVELRAAKANTDGTPPLFSQSTVLANVAYPTNKFTYTGLPSGDIWYFWARVLTKTTGNPSAYIGPIRGASSSNAADIIKYIEAALNDDALVQEIISKTGLVDVQDQLNDAEQRLGVIEGEFDNISGQIASFTPEMAGSTDYYAGSTTGRVGVYSEVSARQENDYYTGRKVDTVVAVAQDAQTQATLATALVQTETVARVNADTAIASQVTTVQSSVGDLSATVQTQAQTIVGINNTLNATYTIKVQIDPGTGKYIAAGMAIGVNNGGSLAQSQIIFYADQLSLITAANGVVSTPFTVLNGQTYIKSVFIQDGSIDNAKIGNSIQSNTVNNSGVPTWKIDKGGTIVLTGNTQATTLDSNGLRIRQTGAGFDIFQAGELS